MCERSLGFEGSHDRGHRAGISDGGEDGLREHNGSKKERLEDRPNVHSNFARIGCLEIRA
jgi:hypothetical protein